MIDFILSMAGWYLASFLVALAILSALSIAAGISWGREHKDPLAGAAYAAGFTFVAAGVAMAWPLLLLLLCVGLIVIAMAYAKP